MKKSQPQERVALTPVVGPLGRWAVGPLGRWAVGPLGRWAVVASVAASSLLMNTPAAHAGSWSFDPLGYNGTSTVPKQGTASATVPWKYGASNADDGAWQGTWSSEFKPGEKQSGKSSGNFILMLRWRPSPSTPGEKIPPFVKVRIQQTAQGSGARNPMTAQPDNDPARSPLPVTPGSVKLTTQVTAPDGKPYPGENSERVLRNSGATSSGSMPTYDGAAYSSLARHPYAVVVISTQGAALQKDKSYLLPYPLPSVSGNFEVTRGSFKIYNDDYTYGHDGAWASIDIYVDYALDLREVYLKRSIEPKIR